MVSEAMPNPFASSGTAGQTNGSDRLSMTMVGNSSPSSTSNASLEDCSVYSAPSQLIDRARCRTRNDARLEARSGAASDASDSSIALNENTASVPRGPSAATAAHGAATRRGTLLKRSNASSDRLADADKCFLPAGRYELSREPEFRSASNVTSYRVSLASPLAGCAFSEGYVAVSHVSETSDRWVRPVANAPITSDFNKIRSCGACSNPHQGIDYGVAPGAQVFAARGAQVGAAEWNGSFGRIVFLYHTVVRNGRAHRLTSRYAHNSALRVQGGARVGAGALIAISGESGSAAQGAHLHFDMLNVHDKYPSGRCRVDPHALSPVFGPKQTGIQRSSSGICQL